MNETITQHIVSEVKRRLQENMEKIHICLERLTLDQIWHQPNASCLSVGNTLIHLNGNVRQYVMAGLLGHTDDRQRSEEFEPKNKLPLAEILNPLKDTMHEVNEHLDHISLENLNAVRPVQCFEESGAGILIHVVEHFSYHVGQIVYITKMFTDQPLGFYDNMDLEKKGS